MSTRNVHREKKRKKRTKSIPIAKKRGKSTKSIEFKDMMEDNHGEVEVCEVLLTNIPRDLKDRFHGYCVSRSGTMVGFIRQFMTDCVTGVFD